MDKRNLRRFIYNIASLAVVASDAAALQNRDDLAEALYNVASDLYDLEAWIETD